jgi:hypothetical protein
MIDMPGRSAPAAMLAVPPAMLAVQPARLRLRASHPIPSMGGDWLIDSSVNRLKQ